MGTHKPEHTFESDIYDNIHIHMDTITFEVPDWMLSDSIGWTSFVAHGLAIASVLNLVYTFWNRHKRQCQHMTTHLHHPSMNHQYPARDHDQHSYKFAPLRSQH